MSDQQRTKEVHDLLKKGLDLKLQFGGHREAQVFLEQAYELVRAPQPLPSPWPEITAYRIAHLKMRGGADADWREVDRLLEQACASDILGPAPLIYRLVSLSKCGSGQPPSAQSKDVYENALGALTTIRDPQGLSHKYTGDGRPIQPQWFNLLELAVYVAELDYEPMQGWIGTDKDPFANLGFEPSAWRVIEDARTANILYPQDIARQHFEQRLRELPSCLAVEFSSSQDLKTQRPDGQWEKHTLKAAQAKDLISLLNGGRTHLPRGVEPNDTVRKRKSRLLEQLSSLLGVNLDEAEFTLWWNQSGPVDRPDSVPPIIMLVGPEVRGTSRQ